MFALLSATCQLLSSTSSAENEPGVRQLWHSAQWLDSVPTADGAIFGPDLLRLFMLEPGFINLNHGSFGTMPRAVYAAQRKNIETMESRPDDWFRGIYQARMDEGRTMVAQYLNANVQDVAFIMNASDGINAILNVACRSTEDYVLRFSFAYPMVKNIINVLEQEGRCKVWIVVVEMPCKSSEDIVKALQEALATNPGRRVVAAIVDHIISVPGIVLPVVTIAQTFKKYGVQRVVVDGAHAIGQVPIDIKALQAAGVDYYITNAHKWLYAPKGCALFVARDPPDIAGLRPLIVGSEYYNITELYKKFDYVGTRDYTAFCTLSTAVKFRRQLGDAQCFYYMHNLARWACRYLAAIWRTSAMVPDDMTACMVNVRLPTKDKAAAEGLYEYMARKKNTSVVMYPMSDGTFWTRLCVQVYISRHDFRRCALEVIAYLKERKALEW